MTTPRLMHDGIAALAAGIAREFPGAVMVAGYINGKYAWSAQEWGLFPHATQVQITITASVNAGDVLDVETGDASPGQAAGWITMRKAAGYYRPTIYCDLATVPAVRRGTGSYILGTDYDIWVASYDNSQAAPAVPGSPPALFAAKQYQATEAWDASAVYDDGWPHRKAPAPPAPALPAAPGGLSSTLLGVDLGWHAVIDPSTGKDAARYRYQVAGGTSTHPGTVIATGVVEATHAHGVKLRGTGPWTYRVQAGGNGHWSAWTPVG